MTIKLYGKKNIYFQKLFKKMNVYFNKNYLEYIILFYVCAWKKI